MLRQQSRFLQTPRGRRPSKSLATVWRGVTTLLRGIAFDDGRRWQPANLGKDHGKYSFREWTPAWTPRKSGKAAIQCRAFNRLGESQLLEPLRNPSGYRRNVVETVNVAIA